MLQNKLKAMKAAAAAKVPPEVGSKMQQALSNLSNSGILQKTIKAGDKWPDFSLADADGNKVDSVQLRQQGPLFVSLYRGVW